MLNTVGMTVLSLLSLAAPEAKEKPVTKNASVVHVVMTTSMGVIELDLDKEKAPLSVDNFVKYAKAGHYNKTIFHRVINNFMIQGGGFEASMTQKAVNAPVKNESGNGLGNDRGTIAMARTNDPDSATSQFYINLKNNDFLNGGGKPGYSVRILCKLICC